MEAPRDRRASSLTYGSRGICRETLNGIAGAHPWAAAWVSASTTANERITRVGPWNPQLHSARFNTADTTTHTTAALAECRSAVGRHSGIEFASEFESGEHGPTITTPHIVLTQGSLGAYLRLHRNPAARSAVPTWAAHGTAASDTRQVEPSPKAVVAQWIQTAEADISAISSISPSSAPSVRSRPSIADLTMQTLAASGDSNVRPVLSRKLPPEPASAPEACRARPPASLVPLLVATSTPSALRWPDEHLSISPPLFTESHSS